MKYIIKIICVLISSFSVNGQNNILDLQAEYEAFKKQTSKDYSDFRHRVNWEYTDFVRRTWDEYSAFSPIPKPKEDNPIPPMPYEEPIELDPITIVPNEVPIVPTTPQPQPIEPVYEHPTPNIDVITFSFYDMYECVRIPNLANIKVNAYNTDDIAEAWNILCNEAIDNTIYDILGLRDKYNLSDWAYLQLLETIANKYCADKNGATLLMAFLYCQSGYQMRLAQDNGILFMLFGSQHQIFDKGYFVIDGDIFYPHGEPSNSIQICTAAFEGERPLSLLIKDAQKLGTSLSERRTMTSERYTDTSASSQVPKGLIDFFNSYPTSIIDGNMMTRWSMYADTPIAEETKAVLYPALRKSIEKCTKLEATNKLLNWVQTGFIYEYDDKVWGHDRAFFAEETLYYPYCDCEDRSILFSHLVRDLLGLDVALIYYPGHLATAVCFDQEVSGDAMIIGDRKFIVCDPTYIGAPVGAQMPDLEYDKAQAIILNR